jgi:phosphoribosylaminoimidazole carboxylase
MTTDATAAFQKKRVGILGGGQLGRMLVEAATPLGIDLTILDPSTDAPAGQLVRAERHLVGDFKSQEQIERLATHVDILTYEIEHVDAGAVQRVVDKFAGRVDAQPLPATIAIIQDKYRQKCHLVKHGVAVADFEDGTSADAIAKIGATRFGYPLMLKSKMLAYDGRGNAVVRSADDIPSAMVSLGNRDVYVEKWVPFAKELAVMVARDRQGQCVCYPVVETVQKDNICHLVFAPAQIDGRVAKRAQDLARQAVASFDGAGIYGVEMFMLTDGSSFLLSHSTH